MVFPTAWKVKICFYLINKVINTVKPLYRILVTITVCIISIKSTYSQLTESDSSLIEAIAYYKKTTEIEFSYDPALIEKIKLDFPYQSLTLPDFIAMVDSLTPLHIEEVKEKYYAIGLVESKYFVTITDATDQQPLPPEIITILVNSQPIASQPAASDYLLFNYLPNESDTVEIFAIGFQKEKVSFEQLLNQRILEIDLNLSTTHLDGVVIEAYITQGINMNPVQQNISIKTSDLPLLPGETDGDVFASIAALPGVTSPDSRAGNLFIRNSPTDQSLILFEGIPIYHRGHYFGTISPYNPQMIDEVKVYRSGFHPRLGGRVGGAVEIGASDEPKSAPGYGIGLNTLYGMAYGKIPVIKDKLSISLGVRHSYPGMYQPPKLRSISEMIFAATGVQNATNNLIGEASILLQDVHSKIAWQPNEKNRLTFSAIYTRSKATYEIIPSNAMRPAITHHSFNNPGFNVTWNAQISHNWSSNSSFIASAYDFRYRIDEEDELQLPEDEAGPYSTNRIDEMGFRQEFQVDLGRLNALQLGADVKIQSAKFTYRAVTPVDSMFTFFPETGTSSTTFSPYTNLEWNALPRLYVQLGMRATYYSQLKDLRLAPRVSLNYEWKDWLVLKGAAGSYYQYLSQVKNLEFSGGGFDNELWLLADGEHSKIMHGTQYMAGAVAGFPSVVIDIEAYHKKARNVTYSHEIRLPQTLSFFTANHTMQGVDVLFKKKIAPTGSLWIGYSLSQSKIGIDTALSVYYDNKYSQPNILSLGGVYAKNNWKISLGWKYASGLHAKSLHIRSIIRREQERIASRPPDAPIPPEIQRLFEIPDRFDPMHALDMSTSYQIPRTDTRRWSATFGVSLINVYDQGNLIDQVVRGRPPMLIDRNAIGFAPNLMIAVEW